MSGIEPQMSSPQSVTLLHYYGSLLQL